MDYLIEIVGAILMGIGSWALVWLKEKWKLDGLAPEFEDLLGKAVKYGERQAKKTGSVNFDNEVLDSAVEFLVDTAPYLMKKLGIKPEQVRQYVESKMGDMLE